MRSTLAAVTIAGALALVPASASTASADDTLVAGPVLSQSEADTEPLDEDNDDDTGKYGLIGLSGLFGLFGYKKYREHRAGTARTTATGTGTTGTGGTSRRV